MIFGPIVHPQFTRFDFSINKISVTCKKKNLELLDGLGALDYL